MDQGRRVRGAVDLRLEQLVHAHFRRERTTCAGVPLLHRRLLRSGHPRENGNRIVGAIDDRGEHLDQQVPRPVHPSFGVAPRVVRELEVDLRVEVGEQREREVGLVLEVEVAGGERAAERSQSGALVQVVDDDDGVEQRGGSSLGDRLDVGQRGVLVGPRRDCLRSDVVEKAPDRALPDRS